MVHLLTHANEVMTHVQTVTVRLHRETTLSTLCPEFAESGLVSSEAVHIHKHT